MKGKALSSETDLIARKAGRRAVSGRIELEGVGVRFGKPGRGTFAVEDIGFTIGPGEFVALLGPSGCGKSTLLNIIAGFLKPHAGEARLDGARIDGPARDRAVVFQQHSLFPWMTARGNVAFGLEMAGEAEAAKRADAFLEKVGLGGQGGKYPAQLSGGQQQRVGLARALINEPEVLLLDEPFGALDAMTRSLMQELLMKLWERSRSTTLFITHDLDEALLLADRVAVMGGTPGRIRRWIDVDLPRPRDLDLRNEPAFQALRREAGGLIRAESLKSFTRAAA
jgi:NitT/TauT family transport system ATP-binding protein